MNTLLSMKLFRRVAEVGNFTEVAREMALSQPLVSKYITALERHLGVKLLHRSTRQLSLTDAGKQYYEHCARILDDLQEIESSLRLQQSSLTGTPRINMPVTFGEISILPHVWAFLEDYPGLSFDLIMDDHYVDLVKEGVDMAIRVGPMTDSNLIARKISDSPRFTVASSAYLAAHGEPNDLHELSAHHCIVYTLLTTRDEWHFKGPEGPRSIKVSGRLSVNNPRAIREAVLAGQGNAVTPIWLMDDCIRDGQVKVILKDYIPTPLEIQVVYPERRLVPAKVRLFIEYIRARLAES